jgi:Type IV secretion system pilin
MLQTAKTIVKGILLSLTAIGLVGGLVLAFQPAASVYAAPCRPGELPSKTNPCTPNNDPAAHSNAGTNLINKYAIPFINLLTAMVGIVVLLSLIVGAIQYSSSADDPSKVAAAKGRIANAIIALFGLLFFYAFLQYLVPGGVFAS